jgi:tetratricopeptide (TPR) repeat protein
MAVKKPTTTVKVEEEARDQEVIRRAKGFWEKNNKLITYGLALVVLIVGGYYVYHNYIKAPKEQKANDAVFTIQKSFQEFANSSNDSTKSLLAQVVLNGDGGANIGAVRFTSKYGGTDASNLCHYYAGAAYLYLKQFDKAVKELKDFNTSSTDVQSRAYGMMADAYSELKKDGDALDYYKKAAELNEKDEYTSSEYLFRAGLFAESIGKKKEAIEFFKKIKEKYPLTEKGNDIDRYLARLGEVNE